MLKGRLPTVALLALTVLVIGCAGPARLAPVRPENVWDGTSPYLCRRAAGPITIDGKDHPGEWAHAMAIRGFFVPISRKTPQSRTAAWMLWDDRNLYLKAVAYDVDLIATLKGRTARLWVEDAVELFLVPPGGKGYYEFEVSPAGALLDLEIPLGRHTRFETRAAWESGAPTAAGVKGTVNESKDDDESFRLVMAIPWKSLSFAGGSPPKPGATWKFIVARCDLSKRYGGKQELSTCVPLPTIDFHPRPQYPTIVFAD